jgi:septal ring factor EnvC (AmiA/AmiB activator)
MAPPGYKKQKIKSSLTHDARLVKMARHIARLERRAKELRYQLRQVVDELRHERRMLKGYAQEIADLQQQPVPPMRLFGGE